MSFFRSIFPDTSYIAIWAASRGWCLDGE